MSSWVPEDALFQVLQWQNMRVPAFPSKMTMVLRFAVQEIVSDESTNIILSHSLYYLCSRLVQAWVEVLFELKRSTGKYSVGHKVGSFMEWVAYDVEQVDNTE